VHAAQTNTYYAYCGKKGHLTAQEAVVAINALGIPCTAQEVLSAGLSGPWYDFCAVFQELQWNAVGGSTVNLKSFLDLAAKIGHAHNDKEEDDALYEAFRFVSCAKGIYLCL
jgi:hypothetical protein